MEVFRKSLLILNVCVLIFSIGASAQEEYQDEYYEEPSEELQETRRARQLEEDIDSLSGLENVEDIAVIQKKYLDKTGRFEFYGSGALGLNSQFFNILGANLKLGYHFNERWGVELQGMFLADLEKSITKSLLDDQAITTKDLVTPSSLYGINLRWSPIYGKLSLREKTINPFEVYFTLGLAMVGTDDSQSGFAIQGGFGQIYPISKNMTFRWGLNYAAYTADVKEDVKGTAKGTEVSSSLFYLTTGVSIYFPFSESR